MKKKLPTVVFFGNERLATGITTSCPTLQALLTAGYNVAAVVLHNESSTSRHKRTLEIAELAKANNIPVLYPSKLAEAANQLTVFKADIGVLVAFGKIIPQAIIDLFPRGIVNIHPSSLPKHRGPTPIESVILNGETETAVSVMKLVREMDAGPVYAQRTLSVPSNISKQELTNQLSETGSKMIVQYLPSILDGSLVPSPQDEARATYDSLFEKSTGQLDWTKPATILEREIRAYHNWPKSTGTIGNHQLIITQVDVETTSGKPGTFVATKKELLVHCGTESLSIKQVQPVNKKEMPIQAFLAGYTL